jgi:glycosyltransferase involved in cell wall biosynthesis
MLRHIDQHGGGVRVYTESLLRELCTLDTPHEFVLMYRRRQSIGRFGDGRRIREVAASAPSVVVWDQVVAPALARREGVDLILNPKYSIPLATNIPCVWVCHGLDWYVQPEWSRWIDRINHRMLIPRFAAKAAKIIAVSHSTREHVVRFLNVRPERVETVYLGVADEFRNPISNEDLEDVRKQFRLPPRFLLYCGQIYPPKNFGRLVKAYAQVGPALGIHLVIAGEHRSLCADELSLIDQLGIADWVVRPGWIDHRALPAFYRLAESLVIPSLYESFAIPILEAMASGCPVVTSDRYGTREVAGDAALLVDPESVESIGCGLRRVCTEPSLRAQLTAAGHTRAAQFSWRKCAEETLAVLETVAQSGTRKIRSAMMPYGFAEAGEPLDPRPKNVRPSFK